MNRGFLGLLLTATLAIFFMAAPVHALFDTHSITWLPAIERGYILSLSYPMCQADTGNTYFYATVKGSLFGLTITDANVFATIRRPDSTTFDVNFTNDLSGAYTQTSNLTQTGTYFIQAHAFQEGKTQGDRNGYLYVKDLGWTKPFLNNGATLNIGDLGTIRNTVTNNDGNLVFDINANTTIYYPSGSVADANGALTQISGGEFVHSYFAPSPAGVYSVTSFFSCGPLTDHNASGRFTVTDTNTGGGTSDSGGTTGSGGAGGGGSSGKVARIISIDFDPALGRNAPSKMSATILNLTLGITDYTLNYTITSPSNQVTVGQKDILAVGPNGTTTVILDSAYTPFEMGIYSVAATLTKKNTGSIYDTFSREYSVQGEHSLILDVAPSSDKTAVGLSFPFTINLLNDGDFAENNIDVSWHILDPEGDEYIRSSYTTALNPNDTASLPYSPFIPINAKFGLHRLIVEVRAYNVTQTKEIVFTVSSPNDYYAQLIEDLQLRIDQLDKKIDSLQQRGFDVANTKLTLLDIQTDLARAKGMLLAGQFEDLNGKLIDISGRITRLAAEIDALEQQSPLLSREGLNLILYIGVGLLLVLFVWLLYWLLEREKKERIAQKSTELAANSPRWLSSLLKVDKCYIPVSERARLGRKSLIDRIIGLIEGEPPHDND